ncbi:MAG: hypothetical protein J7604_03055 [Sporocytophaga sp.]|uniref:hypothetical protein n=1 Tax=Sporocytophaga sp. TaxID=2231183 RepID=UPI001B0903FE|nr:hypothetical protein [Sporocytophaga sp.]MBO9699158.1 hypothetical protein [Sporocytophaga sp.]
MSKQDKVFIFFLLFAAFTIPAIYLSFFNPLVKEYFNGSAPDWFSSLVEHIYPRLTTERNRFPVSFFEEKAMQIVVRISFVLSAFAVFIFLKKRFISFRKFTKQFFHGYAAYQQINILRILFYSSLLYFSLEFYNDLLVLSSIKVFFKPVLLLKITGLGFPSELLGLSLYVILLISCILCILNIYPVFTATTAVLTFLYFQAIFFSFEKIDHGYTTLNYAGLLMPLLLYQQKKNINSESLLLPDWPLKLIKLALCLCYLLAGLEKLFISKGAWLSPITFKSYLYLHQAPLGMQVLNYPVLCAALPVAAMIFQLGFISILWNEKLKWIFLPAGILFHIGTVVLLGISSIINPWIFTYLFFIRWDEIEPLKRLFKPMDYFSNRRRIP